MAIRVEELRSVKAVQTGERRRKEMRRELMLEGMFFRNWSWLKYK